LVRRPAPEHTSRDFETELRELRAHLLAMGARGERIVGLAFDGFVTKASTVMAEVNALDAQIDRDDLEIHALILRMLALRQPVADDLRFLTTALRLVTDLERVGDEAVNIAERAGEPDGGGQDLVTDELAVMAGAARDMLQMALDALVRGDDEGADRVLGCDDDVDRRCASIIASITTYIAAHPAEARAGLRVIRVAKYLERIADHATNIAEEIIFMVRGDDVRHGRWQPSRSFTAEGSRPRLAASGSR
jgi:phosphate transport system protein